MKKILSSLPVIAALGCSNAVPSKNVSVIEIKLPAAEMTQYQPEVAQIKESLRTTLAKTVDVLANDLCGREAKGEIKVKPFRLTQKEIAEVLDLNPLDAASWQVSKKITPTELSHLDHIFGQKNDSRLPLCYDYDALKEGFESLKLDSPLKEKVFACLGDDKEEGKQWWAMEKDLRKSGESAALGFCIAHYGGDYQNTQATYTEKKWTVASSCFATLAASHYGYGPSAKPLFSTYKASHERNVLKARSCLMSVVESLPRE